ncbi:glycosyltransferase [Bacteroidales bacterium OttesenSCG-928-L03]|nr:glycosyltransferase [Bacteroidales bacterium OttesenSCG-928-L03]
MKIALLSPFYPYRGGIAQFSGRLYQELDKEHDIRAFSFSRLYPDFLFPGKTQYVEAGDEAFNYPSRRTLDSINPVSYQKTLKEIRAFAPDVLIIAYWMSFFSPAYTYIARRIKKETRVIALVHNAIPHEPRFFDKPMAKRFFRHVDQFIAMSEGVKSDILSMRPDADILFHPHPLYDHYGEKINQKEALTQLGLDPERKTLLFFGLIRDYKGLDLLIDAFGQLDDSYQLIIAGESYGSFDKYEKQIDALPNKERIKQMIHYISEKDVPGLFSAADLLVLPYRSATQSGVIPLAYHYELPVVATDVGGLEETIIGAGTGLVSPADSLSIASTIQEFFQTGADHFIQGIRQEKDKLSWERFVDVLIC